MLNYQRVASFTIELPIPGFRGYRPILRRSLWIFWIWQTVWVPLHSPLEKKMKKDGTKMRTDETSNRCNLLLEIFGLYLYYNNFIISWYIHIYIYIYTLLPHSCDASQDQHRSPELRPERSRVGRLRARCSSLELSEFGERVNVLSLWAKCMGKILFCHLFALLFWSATVPAKAFSLGI